MNMNTVAHYHARDLHQVSATPRSAYRMGFDDARDANVYYNPFRTGCRDWFDYDAGHEDGMASRNETRRLVNASHR